MSRETTIADVKEKCPVFKPSVTSVKPDQCPFTGLKPELAKSPVLDHGCIVKPGQCKTLGDVTDILESLVPKNEKGKKILAHAIQQAVTLGYAEEKELGNKCPVKQTWPFNTGKDGKPVFAPQTAIDSVYVTMDTVKDKCPVFNKGKACPYNVPELKGLSKGCPYFKNGCPFKGVKDVGEFRQKLGEMRDKCSGKENYNKAFELTTQANLEQVAKLGHCPFHQYGCQINADLKCQPITTNFVDMDTIKTKCPVFQKGKFCPYKIPCMKGLSKGCPEFKNGCPFKDVKNVGEFKAKLGGMRDECKGKANYDKALDMIAGVNGVQTSKFGHCPFFQFGCMMKTDPSGKPIVPDLYTMDNIKEKCPVFQKGKSCPYNVPELKGLAKGCPSFKDGCPFKNVKDVGEFKAKMREMNNECKAPLKYNKAIELVHAANGEAIAKHGHCPFFKNGCALKSDLNDRSLGVLHK